MKKFYHYALRITHYALLFGLLALILVINFSVTNAAIQLPNNPVTSKQVSAVSDKCGLLSAAEIDSLNKKIQHVEQTHKIKLAISFVKSTNGQDIVTASDNMRDKLSNAPNGKIVLLVNMENRRYEIATDTVMMNIITNGDGIPYLKNKIKPDLHNGNYSGACNNFVDGIDELVTFYETHGQPYVNTEAAEEYFAARIVISFILAVIAFVFIRSHLISAMSNVRHAAQATDYLEKNSVKLTDTRDMFLFQNVRRVRKSSKKDNGGSHRGGGGGGGSF